MAWVFRDEKMNNISEKLNKYSVFMCNNKFLFDEALKIGYEHDQAFQIGNITGKPLMVSWRGNTSLDWDRILELVFDDTNNTDPQYGNVDFKLNYHNIDTSNFPKVNLMIEQCTKIENITNIIWFFSKDDMAIKILVSDPNLQLSFRQNLVGISGDIIRSRGDAASFTISTTILKKRPEKNSCKKYDTPEGYKQCVEKSVRQKFINLLGCIPPWMTKFENEAICSHDIQFNDEHEANKVKSQIFTFHQMAYYAGIDDFGCKLPCTQVHLAVHQTKNINYKGKINWLDIQFEDTVSIWEETNNYTFFNLLVEIGSSLGLWIGLSVIGIFDLFFDISRPFFKPRKMKTKNRK